MTRPRRRLGPLTARAIVSHAGRMTKRTPIQPVGSPRPCRSDLVGKTLPGKRGGKIIACAVPPRRTPRVQYVFVRPEGGLPGSGFAIKSSRARRRIRDAAIELIETDAAFLRSVHDEYRETRIPSPSGLEFPHQPGSSICDPQHRVWAGYEEARADASERASIEAEDGDDGAFLVAMRAALARHPQWPAWQAAAQSCAERFAQRERERAPKTAGAEYERAQLRKRARGKLRGEDERDAFGGDYLSEALDATTENYKRKKGLPRSLRAKAHPSAKRARRGG